LNFVEYAKERGYDENIVLLALKLAVEESARRHYGIVAVNATLKENKVHMVFRIPKDIKKDLAIIAHDQVNAADDDVFYSFLKINSQPPEFVKTVKVLFIDALETLNLNKFLETWGNLKHDVVYGVICSNDQSTVEVDIQNQDGYNAKGIMAKKFWVKSEIADYKLGKGMMFYVSKISTSPLILHLSRSSIHFPEKLFENRQPWNSFKSAKRYPGEKSFLRTNAPLDKQFTDIVKDISSELSGEIIEIKNFKKK